MASAVNEAVAAEVQKFQQLQTELTELVGRRQTLQSQLNENSMVKSELDLVEENATVYKLVGPVLLKQDREEATESVKRRLEFIETEMTKVAKSIQSKENQADEIRKKISELQMEMKRQAAAAAQSVIGS